MAIILIAEDNTDVRVLLHRIFTRAGHAVLQSSDGRTALQLARQHPPDVVLTDLDMPHLDGLELCQAIRADPVLRDTPVAILSGGLQPGDPRTDHAHVCGVLLKPFTNDDLIAAVTRLADAGAHAHPTHCTSRPTSLA